MDIGVKSVLSDSGTVVGGGVAGGVSGRQKTEVDDEAVAVKGAVACASVS